MTETKYGIISDTCSAPANMKQALSLLKNEGIEKLILNGNIGGAFRDVKESQTRLSHVLNIAAKSDIMTFVQPGSSEQVIIYQPVIEYFENKYPNIINALRFPFIEGRNHDIAFIPGAHLTSIGEYYFGNGELETRLYAKTDRGRIVSWESFGKEVRKKRKVSGSPYCYYNINDLAKSIRDPEKTIVFCHAPRKFGRLETAVDMAEFGEIKKSFFADIVYYHDGETQIRVRGSSRRMPEIVPKLKKVEMSRHNESYHKGGRMVRETSEILVKAGAPIEIKQEDMGSNALSELYEKLGVTKAVSGHFRESVHRAHDKDCLPLEENMFHNELFWNASYLDGGKAGILAVRENEVSYRNITL